MPTRNWRTYIFAAAGVCLLLGAVTGCASTAKEQPAAPAIARPPIFPPQETMRNGKYAELLAQSESTMKTCEDPEQCAVALFNLAFLYCYSKSPYYNPSRGLKYLDDLIKGVPDTPWASQARVWADLMKKSKAEPRKRHVREDAKSKEPPPEPAPEVESRPVPARAEESAWEEDKNRLEQEIKSRDDAIRQLKGQIERSRQIDMEIEKKERGLRY
ncbi:MAG: hypothetical protein LLG06_10310 [Desulfobacteraceae bacterium]|nr:hypothetical protein [Desulfobacteraceae bacterium]